MGEQGAALQKYNQELVKCIEQLKIRKEELSQEVEEEEQNKNVIENEIKQLNLKLDAVNSSLKKKKDHLEACERSIRESEAAFIKILESSQILLSKVLKESEELQIEASDE